MIRNEPSFSILDSLLTEDDLNRIVVLIVDVLKINDVISEFAKILADFLLI